VTRARILIKGAGEMASATAHRLFLCGYRVAMVDLPRPTAVRRTVSFCSAIRLGSCEVEGVRAVAYPARDTSWLPS
jgi:xanthine dehydrogenase accessory factor